MRSVTAARIGSLTVPKRAMARLVRSRPAARGRTPPGIRAEMKSRWIAVLALLAASACAERSTDMVVQVDSAGVRVVESRAPAWPPGTEWRVSPEPVFRLGGAEAESSSSFFRILDVALLAGGELIVVDGGSAELRRYDAAGGHLWSTGGRGEGPGEFRGPRYLGRREDGAFLIWDRSLLRLSVVAEDGEVLLSERRTSPDGSEFIAFGLFDDGAWLVANPRRVSAPAEGTAWTDTVPLGRYDPAPNEQVGLARVPGHRWIWTGQHMLPVPFSPRPLRTILGDRLAVASGPAAEVSIHDRDGSLAARYRIARDSEPVTESDIGQVIESLVEIGQGPAAVWRQWRDRMDIPAEEPAFDLLLADEEGHLWAQRFLADPLTRESPTWDLFDSTGTWLGAVATPGGLIVTAIREGLVAGIFRDELGVEYVTVHRIATDAG